MTDDRETVPCRLCGRPTPMTGTKLCDAHFELESRVLAEPDLARRILATKDGAAEPETWQHVANEWADMATSGIQAVRNIIDGIETPEAVFANMNLCYSHCAEVQSRAKATPPAVMPAAPSEIELQHREALDCLDSVMRAASHVLVGLAPSEKEAKLRSVLSKAHDWCMTERAALSQTMQPQAVAVAVAVADDFIPSVRRLCIAARTTGGTAGRDEGLCRILDRVEAMLEAMHSPEWKAMVAAPAAGEQAGAVALRKGHVVVPMRLTRAMQRILDEEGWEWADLLMAAEATTEEEDEAIRRFESLDLLEKAEREAAERQEWPTMHPATADLVQRFSQALAEKLAAAEKKYGYSDGWLQSDWMDECRAMLLEHVAKGDPRDVAAYCAFLWHHGESTTLAAPGAAIAAREQEAGWEIDQSAGRPILTYKKCSVIEAEDAEYVLRLIAADRAAPSKGVRKALERLVHDVRDLAKNSAGVAGLHLNGDVAQWGELTEGGRFDDWLGLALEQADSALTQPTTVQPDAYNRKLRAQLEQEWSSLNAMRRAEQPSEAQIEAAAKVIAECMDYPWEHMAEQGKDNMRMHAKAVAAVLNAGAQLTHDQLYKICRFTGDTTKDQADTIAQAVLAAIKRGA